MVGVTGICVAGVTVTMMAQGTATPRHLLLVVSKQQPGIALYNAETDALHCKSGNLGVAPHEGEFSPDGRMVYVPTYGSSSVGAPGTDEHTLHFIRTSDCQTVFTLDTGEYKRPHHVQVGRSGLVYVTAELNERVLIVDPQKRAIVGTIPTGSNTTHFISLTDDEKQIFASNVMGRTLSVLDVPGRTLVKTIPTETNNQRMTISPDQKWFVTNLGQERKVAFYKVADGTLDFTVEVDGGPFVSRFSADGKYLYTMGSAGGGAGRAGRGGAAGARGGGAAPEVAGPTVAPASANPPAAAPAAPQGAAPAAGPPARGGRGAGGGQSLRAWKIDVASRQVVGTIAENLGGGAGGLAVNPVNGRVYMTAMANDLMTVIDPSSWTVVKQISTEDNPDGIFFGSVK
jgi:YVTN family beta-propeller protein